MHCLKDLTDPTYTSLKLRRLGVELELCALSFAC